MDMQTPAHRPGPIDPSRLSRRAVLATMSGLSGLQGLAGICGISTLLLPGAVHAQTPGATRVQSWPVNAPTFTGIHDIAPAPDGGMWFSAQRSGHLGWFDPRTGKSDLIALGNGVLPAVGQPGRAVGPGNDAVR